MYYRIIRGMCCILLWLAICPLAAEVISIDKIAAVVNQQIITQSDIDKAIQFFPVFRKKNQSDREFYAGVLQDLIHYKLISLEYSDEIFLRDEDYTDVQTSAINKVGSYDKLLRQLRRWNMSWKGFKAFIKEKVVYEKVLKQKFPIKIDVGFNEIETFYNEQYLPAQNRLKLKPRTLIEMTRLIENQLRKERLQEPLAQWLKEIAESYKIEIKLNNNQ